MRFPHSAATAGLWIMTFGLWLTPAGSADFAAAQETAARKADAPAPADSAPGSAAAKNDATGMDAAARHAKRVACLKEARSKKLVGTARNSYVKNCLAGH